MTPGQFPDLSCGLSVRPTTNHVSVVETAESGRLDEVKISFAQAVTFNGPAPMPTSLTSLTGSPTSVLPRKCQWARGVNDELIRDVELAFVRGRAEHPGFALFGGARKEHLRAQNPEVAGSNPALHPDPWTSSAHTPALCPYAPWCAARARTHLGACLSDLVRKFAHVSGVRTQWPSAESRREVGLGADDCVSSKPGARRAASRALALCI